MSAMYGQSNLQQQNGQLSNHLLGSASLSNNSSSNSTLNGPNNEQSNLNTNGLIDGHLLVEPKQEPEINMQLMQL